MILQFHHLASTWKNTQFKKIQAVFYVCISTAALQSVYQYHLSGFHIHVVKKPLQHLTQHFPDPHGRRTHSEQVL